LFSFETIDEIVDLEKVILSCSGITSDVSRKNRLLEQCKQYNINIDLYGIDERVNGVTTNKPYFTEVDVVMVAMYIKQQSLLFEKDVVRQRAYDLCLFKMTCAVAEETNNSFYEIHLYTSELLHEAFMMNEAENGSNR
jgi:hypothetical protein